MPVRCDVSRFNEIDALYEQVIKEFQHVEIVVNNAGATWGAPSLRISS